MTEEKLKWIYRKIRSLRKARDVHDRELVAVAKKLGRTKAKTSGGHPQYISNFRSGRITIPSHAKPLKYATKESILDELEADVLAWGKHLQSSKPKHPKH